MFVLVACEESQTVCKAFRASGHTAFSCDLQECSGGCPQWHIKADCIPLLDGFCSFLTSDGRYHYIPSKWDLIIAHPPCTFLSNAGMRWFSDCYGDLAALRKKNQLAAIDFFNAFLNCNCDHICIENPVGIMNTLYRSPDQIIQPYQFCKSANDLDYQLKTTCLWLRGLPLLMPTNALPKPFYEKYYSKSNNCYKSKSWVLSNRNAKTRSKTFEGVAAAMAAQWGNDLDSFIYYESEQITFIV